MIGVFATIGGALWALGRDVIAQRRGDAWHARARRPDCGCADAHIHSPIGCLAAGCTCRASRP